MQRIYSELTAAATAFFPQVELEILFVDNHSTDRSFEIAQTIVRQDSRAKIIRLSRNFGYQASILTGYLHATGDAAVQLDSDGEDDPKLIGEFVKLWEQGFQVVYGIRHSRQETPALTFTRKLFYRFLTRFSPVPLPQDAGDFRLITRDVIEHLRNFKEANPYLRGLVSYIGFKQVGLPYDRRPRYSGERKISAVEYFALAWDGITSFTKAPLTFSGWIGLAVASVSFFGILFYLGLHFSVGTNLPGFTTLILVQLFLMGIQMLLMGILGTYIGRIFDEVKCRPKAIIETRVD